MNYLHGSGKVRIFAANNKSYNGMNTNNINPRDLHPSIGLFGPSDEWLAGGQTAQGEPTVHICSPQESARLLRNVRIVNAD